MAHKNFAIYGSIIIPPIGNLTSNDPEDGTTCRIFDLLSRLTLQMQTNPMADGRHKTAFKLRNTPPALPSETDLISTLVGGLQDLGYRGELTLRSKDISAHVLPFGNR